MVDTPDLRKQLDDVTMKPANLSDLVNVSAVLKNAADAEKSRADALDAQNKSEVLRFWIPVLAPSVTAFALVATLAIQMYQLHENSVAQRVAAEDTAWREVTRDLRATSGPAMPIALHQLRSFLESKRYARSARELSVTLLSGLSLDAFEIVIPDVLRETNWSNLPDLARLTRGLNRTWDALANQLRAATNSLDSAKAEAVTIPGHDVRLRAAEQQQQKADEMVSGVIEELRVTSRGIAAFIRSNQASRPKGVLDLRFANFLGADLSKLSLENVDLTNGSIQDSSIVDACICSATVNGATLWPTDFAGSKWTGTAWWRASSVSRPLLQYLENSYRFDPRQRYQGSTPTGVEYADAVKNLRDANETNQPPS